MLPSPSILLPKVQQSWLNYASNKSGTDAVVSHISGKGGEAVAVQANVALPEDIERLFAETKRAYGKLGYPLEQRGHLSEFAPLDAVTPEHIHKHFNLNVAGLLLTTKEAVKLIGSESGSIVNIRCIVGPMPAPHASTYSASKAAVNALNVPGQRIRPK